MYENSVCEIDLVPVTFWPPALARRAGEYIRQTAPIAITGILTCVSVFGIVFGFAGVTDQDDTIVQPVLHSLAVFTGLIG